MKIRLKEFKRLLVESALIVFSVLFALFINRYAENQKMEKQKQVALERISQEMKSNREHIAKALEIHKIALQNLQQAASDENDSLRIYMAEYKYFLDQRVFHHLLDGQISVYPVFPVNTSWQAALATGIVSEFNYQIVEILADVYSTQEYFMEETFRAVTEIISLPIENENQTINTLLFPINELVQQEQKAIDVIDEALKIIYLDTEEQDQ
ncbi:MAG: hypothetical protein AAF632_00780 [Bacteroidota bacterium]